MAVENITLNLIPTGDTPSIHVAQFDVDRPFTVTLKEGEDDFTPTGYTIELQVRKVDSTIVTVAPSSSSGNVVTFNTTEQMTACSGTNIAELQLTKDSQTFATLHFYLVVQRDVLAGGVTSESDIYNLTEQIAAIVPEVIGDDYYNKEEVDEKIAEIPTFDPTNYYDKSETNSLLADKANTADLATVATTGDYNDLENKPTIPDMSNYYTKTEVDNKITGLYEIKTATGSLVHITDGGNNIPVKSFECEIGSTGYSQADITVCGKNLFSNSGVRRGIYTNLDGSTTSGALSSNFSSAFIKCKPSTTYTIELFDQNYLQGSIAVIYYDAGMQGLNDGTTLTNLLSNTPKTFTTPASAVFFVITGYRSSANGGTDIFTTAKLLITDSSDTTYEAYNGTTYTVEFGSTFNDGTLIYENGEWYIDVSGTITPITSSTRVKTISGENNIFSTTGSCEVGYFTSKSDGIAELIKAFM